MGVRATLSNYNLVGLPLMDELWSSISWKWRGLWSKTQPNNTLEIRLWGINLFIIKKIGCLGPSSLQRVISQLPLMSRIHQNSTIIFIHRLILLHFSGISLIPSLYRSARISNFLFHRFLRVLICCFIQCCWVLISIENLWNRKKLGIKNFSEKKEVFKAIVDKDGWFLHPSWYTRSK